MGYWLIKMLASPFVRLFWVGSVDGLENIPKKGSCIIAANHKSFLDFILLFVVVPRQTTFLAAEKFFKSPFWLPIMKLTGQIKVERDAKDKRAVYEAVKKVFERGGVLGIFPEGTRSRDGKMHKAFSGISKFSHMYNVPVVPVGIQGTFHAWPPHQRKPKFKKCSVHFGKILSVTNDSYDTATAMIMRHIAELANETYEET